MSLISYETQGELPHLWTGSTHSKLRSPGGVIYLVAGGRLLVLLRDESRLFHPVTISDKPAQTLWGVFPIEGCQARAIGIDCSWEKKPLAIVDLTCES